MSPRLGLFDSNDFKETPESTSTPKEGRRNKGVRQANNWEGGRNRIIGVGDGDSLNRFRPL